MSDRISKAVFGVAAVVLVSRVLGFVREMTIADRFGTSSEYDLYLIAVMLPTLFYGVINFAAIYFYVPYISSKIAARREEGSAGEWRALWPIINFSILASLLLIGTILICAPFIMRLWSNNYLAGDFDQIVYWCRLLSFMIFLGTLEAFMRAYLNVKKIYAYPAGGYIAFNLISIGCIIFFSGKFSVGAIVYGLLGGLLLQNIYLSLAVWRYKPLQNFHRRIFDTDTKVALGAASIIIAVELINRVYFLIDRYVAPDFGTGIISALNYSQVLVQLPDSILGFALGTVVFPLLSRDAHGDGQKFRDMYSKSIQTVVFWGVPLTIVYLLSTPDLILVLFKRGVFDLASVNLTTTVLRPYAFSIIPLFIIGISLRACYAQGLGKRVLQFAIIALMIKFAGNFLLPRWFGYGAISAATSLAHLVTAAALLSTVILHTMLKERWQLMRDSAGLIGAGIISFTLLWFGRQWLLPYLPGVDFVAAIARLVGVTIATLVVYLFACRLIGMGALIRASSDVFSFKRSRGSS